jgi:hypothetical protein
MPKLLRLRFCHVGHHRARMENLTLPLEDIVTGQATHSVVWLRNGGGKTTLISLILWLLCPDRPMPNKNRIEEYVQPDDRSVLVAEWQMDQQPSLWTGKPERYLTGVFCEWRSAASQEGKKLQHFFFASRVIEEEPRLSLERLPLFVSTQGQSQRRVLASFRQVWKELDHAYPQAGVEYTETFTAWRETLERIGIDPELFRYQLLMNTREGGAAEPFMFKENERFVNFFLELMDEAATGNEIATNIQTWREQLFYLRQQLEPTYQLLQTLTKQLTILCGVADERDRLCQQIGSAHKEIGAATFAVRAWREHRQQELDTWKQREQQAHEAHLCQKEEARQHRRRALLLRHAAVQKRVQQLQRDVETWQALVQEKKRQVVIWQAAIPLRSMVRAREKADGIQKRLRALLQVHEPLLQTLQASARRYYAALSFKVEHLRQEEIRLRDLAQKQQAQALQLRKQETEQLLDAQGYDTQAQTLADELKTVRALRKKLEDRGVMQPGERWEGALQRLLRLRSENLEQQHTLEETIETLEHEQQDLQEQIARLGNVLSALDTQIQLEQGQLKLAQEAREQIANDQVLRQYLEVTELDFDHLTPQALDLLKKERDTAEERIAQLKISLVEQEAIIEYLSAYGFLPPAQAVTQVIEFLKKERITVWSGWQYLTESIREVDRRSWLQRLPALAFGVVLPDDQWEQARHLLQTTSPYLETPVVIFARRDIQEQVSGPGWTIGPTSEAYFNTSAGNRELFDRQQRYQQQKHLLEERIGSTNELKRSIDLLDRTFAQYPTSWFQLHQQTVADAQLQQAIVAKQRRTQDQALQYCTSQIALRKQGLQQLQTSLQQVENHLIQLQDYETQLTADPGALQEREYQQRAQAGLCRSEAQKLRTHADDKDNEARDTTQKEKQAAEEAREREVERSRIDYLEGDPPVAHPGDTQVLRDQYESLCEQYRQQIGEKELQSRYDDAKREEQQAYQRFRRKLQKSVSEQEVRQALDTLTDPDEAEEYEREALVTQVTAESEQTKTHQELASAAEALQEIKKKLRVQGIDELEGSEYLPEREQDCLEAAKAEERLADSNEQTAQQQKEAEQIAQQNVRESALKIESLGRVENQIRMMQNGYASLLSVIATAESQPDQTELDDAASHEEEQTVLREEDIDQSLRELEERIKHMQQEKEELDRRSRQASQTMVQELNKVRQEFPEVLLAKHLLEHQEEAYEQHCREFLSQMNDRLQWVQEHRDQLQVHRDALIQHLLTLAEAGMAFLKSATKYSKLPATLPAFEQRPFLRIHLTEPASREERVGKIADLLDTLVKDKGKAIPSGVQLLQQAVHRLASPMSVQILFPDPGDLHYVAPTRMMKESGGERLTSMVLLYCTLLRMRTAHRTKPAGKSSCLILDNPMGVASHTMFLELQREVAQAMDMQLIYTTAIKDFDALHIFSNVIRIRNDRRDRRTGDHLLALDTPSESRLEAARIMHSETRDFAQEHQERQS